MNVLLSIKPKHAESIINGTKKYEFRRIIFRNRNIHNVYVYSTSPVQKIVGSFKIGNILEDQPPKLWDNLKDLSGLNETEFFDYFKNCDKGFAIEVKDVEKFGDPIDPKNAIPGFVPPQSFCYLKHYSIPFGNDSQEDPRTLNDFIK